MNNSSVHYLKKWFSIVLNFGDLKPNKQSRNFSYLREKRTSSLWTAISQKLRSSKTNDKAFNKRKNSALRHLKKWCSIVLYCGDLKLNEHDISLRLLHEKRMPCSPDRYSGLRKCVLKRFQVGLRYQNCSVANIQSFANLIIIFLFCSM